MWDSILSGQEPFHSHRFLRAVEDARVAEGRFWYLLFYRGEVVVATAVLSAFVVSLDLLVGGTAARLIRAIRRRTSAFLRIKVLCCGIPISLGQGNLMISPKSEGHEILPLLAGEMSAIAQSEGIHYLCVKEFLEPEIEKLRRLESCGFFLANSIPYVTLPIRWESFEAYLASLRHNYRRPIRLSLKKIRRSEPVIEAWGSVPSSEREPRMVVGGGEVCPPGRFFELYLQVMERTPVKLETLNRAFFENLYAVMGADLEVLALIKDGEPLGVALLTSSDGTLTFMLVGLDYARRDEHDVYFNLMYAIVQLAIQRGCTQLHLGQTSYWLKGRLGGVCIPEMFYFKSDRRAAHVLLKTVRAWVFPRVKPRQPRVFRTIGD